MMFSEILAAFLNLQPKTTNKKQTIKEESLQTTQGRIQGFSSYANDKVVFLPMKW